MIITLVGCGALGSLFGYRLSQTGHDVQVLQRPGATLERLKKRGIEFDDRGTVHHFSITAEHTPSLLNRADLVIVTVKAFATGEIAPLLPELLSRQGLILTIQNGLGNGEKLASVIEPDRISLGACTYGAYRDDGIAHMGGEGHIFFGPLKPGREWLSVEKALSDGGFSVSVVEDPMPEIWSKLVVNAAINPVSALIRLENGHILSDEETTSLSRHLTEETCSVAKSIGISLNKESTWLKVKDIIEKTAENRSSMLQDILAGRATEIEAISGEILRLGHHKGFTLPCTETVYALVKGLEKNCLRKIT